MWPCLLGCVALAISAPGAAAEPRVALVIGNGTYISIPRLTNPVADAKLMARTLSGFGFKVTELIDADQSAMKTAIAEFGRALRASGPETIGLFYYAGHGVQSSGVNYLLPVDSKIRDEADLDLVGVEGRWVVRQMESARNLTNIVILDACRSNPFAAAGVTAQGLARMDAPTGTFIAYSTAPGNVALDGKGANSPFTTALAAAMARPALPIEELFKQVRVEVLRETAGAQTPWDSSSLVRDFAFNTAVVAAPSPGSEAQAWETARVSNDTTVLLAFLRNYPRGSHLEEAQTLVKALRAGGPAGASAPGTPPAPGASTEIHFSTPLAVGSPDIDGKSIEQLVRGSPMYPPIEGLPEPAWQGKHCPICHGREWTQKTLCDQGLFYIKTGETRTLSVKHPFGNAFGLTLRTWAAAGCQ